MLADRPRRARAPLAAALLALAAWPPATAQDRAPPTVTGSRLPRLPPAEFDPNLAIGGDDVAARKLATRMTVGVRVAGRGPYRFVVDSGADTSVVGERLARSLKLPSASAVMLHGMTASGLVQRAHVGELGLGQTTLYDLRLPILREDHLGADGMLGIDALVSQRLMMDFDKRLITVEDARRPTRRLDGEIVVTARRRRGQLILTQASVDGRRLDAVIDTGSEVSIGNSALRAQLAKRYARSLETAEMIGVTGVAVKIDLVRVDELKLGPVVLRNVPIAFADVPPFRLFGLDQQPALLLGTDMMATFRRVSLDFKARKVRFQLRRCASQGITISTTATPMQGRLLWSGGTSTTCL